MFLLLFNPILTCAAVIPAIWLMVHIYRADRMEPESPALLGNLVWQGVLSTVIATVAELLLPLILKQFLPEDSQAYQLWFFFFVVGFSEEAAKFFLLHRRTWRVAEFDCTFDGVVYAAFVSLGFALMENIKYVFSFGLTAALVRAVTAVPGHACFGVFMGAWYGAAKYMEQHGQPGISRIFRILSLATATLLHGAYDYIASAETGTDMNWKFLIFVVCLFAEAYLLVNHLSKNDKYVQDVGRF